MVIRSLDRDPIRQTIELQGNIIETKQTTAQVCQANREAAAKNALTIEGRGGVRAAPDSPLDSRVILGEDDASPLLSDRLNSTSATPPPIETAQGKIQLARGVKVTQSGEVILTAYRTNNAGERIPERRDCSQNRK